ncbi:hypothetical protein [Lentzea albidocapillata]|uniref:Uncharacterized protein n=1 Tax=Lentzea albidocapillata TaxID=40571 RepID=A0A1W2FHL9_9PSEU|nr:hypothetical protein [Lentzea albidocapillata]SMD21545.1 hypothetical protein SAMN05660733_06459 [Lentzea albidocapillata]
MGDLDDDLRRLFSDDRLVVHVPPDVTDSVVRGARRRRRRRTAVASVFGVVALAGVGLGLAEIRLRNPGDLAGPLLPTASSGTPTSPPPISVSTFTSIATVTVDPPPNSNGGNPSPNLGTTGKKTTNPPPPATPEAQAGRYGSLALGMSEANALKTGSLVEPSTPADEENRCTAYATQSVPDSNAVIVSPVKGIVRITLAAYAKTPKNVGAGSTVDAVKTAYPNATQSGSAVVVAMAATPKWSYIFESDGAKVTTVQMRLSDNDCSTV